MSAVPSLPRAGQRTRSAAAVMGNSHVAAQESLARAFMTFTQAAGSLEKSYTQLHGEVARLHLELQRANSELERSLEENSRMRGYLSRVMEKLPCGVVVVSGADTVQIINPEARRLLQVAADWTPGQNGSLPPVFERLIAETPENSFFSEQERCVAAVSGNRSIGILRANLSEKLDSAGDTIWIVRDITEQKRVAGEREAARRSVALAEIATVLAHEIRNPLGSMELFTGLLADATAHLPETRQWVTHLQAGLRALAATMTNVVDVYINYLRRKVDTGYERALIRTIRGVGYQIGGNSVAAHSAATAGSLSS
jgi:nitrogen fixation/metabolism regulation signal transduction histidine kinase